MYIGTRNNLLALVLNYFFRDQSNAEFLVRVRMDDESYGLLIIPMGRDQKSACPCIMSAKEAKNSNNLKGENCA